MPLGNLEMLDSRPHEMEMLAELIRTRTSPAEGRVEILEAGCGRRWPIALGDIPYCLTGLDLDPVALEIRKSELKDLHVAIHGDLRTHEFPEGSFDTIYCSFVLEHVSGAESVLENFARWLRPGGLLIVRVPDPETVHGFVSKTTPHWFHVLYYRAILHNKNAGKPGYGPYPVFFDRVVSRQGFREFCDARGMELLAEYGDRYFRSGRGLNRRVVDGGKKLIDLASRGTLSAEHSNLVFVAQKAMK